MDYYQSDDYYKQQNAIGNNAMFITANNTTLLIVIENKILRILGSPECKGDTANISKLLKMIDEKAKEEGVKLSIWNTDFKMDGRRYKYRVKQYLTSKIDLTPTEEQLLTSFKKEVRRNIVHANGIIVREGTTFKEIEKAYKRSYKLSNKEMPERFFETVEYNMLKSKCFHYYYAESDNGNLLGTLAMVIYKEEAKELHSSTTEYAYNNKLNAQDILHWHLIKEAKRLGCKRFDLAGYELEPKTPKEKGIKQFKTKWNGQEYNMYEYRKYYGRWRMYYGIKRILQG